MRSEVSPNMISRFRTAAVLAALLSVGCGSQAAKPAESPTTAAPAMPPAPATAPAPGQQFAISDAPTSGEAVAERPKMNATATTAYNAGMTAFQAGDLAGAKTQFTQATQADAKAYQAFYSLGVVRERLGDTPGALAAYRQATLIIADYEPAIFAYAVLLARSGRADEAVEYVNGRWQRCRRAPPCRRQWPRSSRFKVIPARRSASRKKR
jgi:tetratricopeptide (TPR) repeat protein